MTSPLHETLVETTEIDRIIEKVFPLLAEEQTTTVIVALISMVVMAMHPHLEGQELVNAVEQASGLLVTLGIPSVVDDNGVAVAH